MKYLVCMIVSFFIFNGCGGIVDNGAEHEPNDNDSVHSPGSELDGAAFMPVELQSEVYAARFPNAEWVTNIETNSINNVTYNNQNKFVMFAQVNNLCSFAVNRINKYHVKIYECNNTKINLMVREGLIIEAQHNLNSKEIAVIADSFRKMSE